MDEISAHTPNGTPNQLKVNIKTQRATAPRKLITITAKDRFLQGLESAAKEKGLTLNQLVKEYLENSLIKDGHLPSWWHTRQF